MSDAPTSAALPDADALADAVRAALLSTAVNEPEHLPFPIAFLLALSQKRGDAAALAEALRRLDDGMPLAFQGVSSLTLSRMLWTGCAVTAARLTGDPTRRSAVAGLLETLMAEAQHGTAGGITANPESVALAASALACASWGLDEPGYLTAAEAAIGSLKGRSPSDVSGLMMFGAAQLDVYEATGQSVWLRRSRQTAVEMFEAMGDPNDGLFFSGDHEHSPTPSRELHMAHYRSFAAIWYSRLSIALGEPQWLERALTIMRRPAYAAVAAPDHEPSAAVALALLRVAEEPAHIVILGEPDDPRTQALLGAALRVHHWNRLAQAVSPRDDGDLLEALGYDAGSQPMAYVCFNLTCSPPIADASRIDATLTRLRDGGGLALLGGMGAAGGGGIAPLGGRGGLGGGVGFLSLRPRETNEGD